MPAISMFYGIVIYLYDERNSKHNFPHIHAKYGEYEVVINIFNGKIIEGGIPSNKLKLVIAWMELHKEDLMLNWELMKKGEQPFRIIPLN